MQITRSEKQAISDLVGIIQDYLPGACPYYGDPRLSFQGIARNFELGDLWKGNSKRISITELLEATLTNFRYKFCPYIYQVISTAIDIRKGKADVAPVTMEEIKRIERILSRLGMNIPEFKSPDFIQSLPTQESQGAQQVLSDIRAAENYTSGIETKVSGAIVKHAAETQDPKNTGNFSKITAAVNKPPQDLLKKLRDELISFARVEKDVRGYFFEAFLNKLFTAAYARFRYPLELKNNAIHGVVEISDKTYLVQAHWEGIVTKDNILEYREKLKESAVCSHALIISYSGFTDEASSVLSLTGHKYLILADGRDLFMVLESGHPINKMIDIKTKYAENEGRLHVSMQEIMSTTV